MGSFMFNRDMVHSVQVQDGKRVVLKGEGDAKIV